MSLFNRFVFSCIGFYGLSCLWAASAGDFSLTTTSENSEQQVNIQNMNVLTVSFQQFGGIPDQPENAAPAAAGLIAFLQENCRKYDRIVVNFAPGIYHFYPSAENSRNYFISNHDQTPSKAVCLPLEKLVNVTLDGNGAEIRFHGRMIAFSMVDCDNCTLRNFVIDSAEPTARQLVIRERDEQSGDYFAEILPRGAYELVDGKLFFTGDDYRYEAGGGMQFEPDGRLTYQCADPVFRPETVEELEPYRLRIRKSNCAWRPGQRFVFLHTRPAPGIFLHHADNSRLENLTLHYADGMGLLAQMSENILLDGFRVWRREGSERYFTTRADATHFSGCRGLIVSKNGSYEAMADDAINVHGTYLKILEKTDNHTVRARYMHEQSWGFDWGEPGDEVQLIRAASMEKAGGVNRLTAIRPADAPTAHGAREFILEFADELPEPAGTAAGYGVENLTWSPRVLFQNNLVRNNRARGALFSTPREVICEDNVFDHVHGTAILLCGDCNGWFETGACTDVEIRRNRFINVLTANYQFTNAVISIYPEIPVLTADQAYFHANVRICDNEFDSFDRPLLYAKSIEHLTFAGNTVRRNDEFPPFHWNRHLFFFEHVADVTIAGNHLAEPFDPAGDLLLKLTDPAEITIRPAAE